MAGRDSNPGSAVDVITTELTRPTNIVIIIIITIIIITMFIIVRSDSDTKCHRTRSSTIMFVFEKNFVM